MKRLFYFSAILFAIITSSSSCKKKLLIIITHYDFNVTIPAQAIVPPGGIIGVPITVESQVNNTEPRVDLIENATLPSAYVNIDAPVGKTFSWCQEIHVSLVSEDLPETEIAYKNNIDPKATHIDLDVTNADLAAFLKKPQYTVRTKVVLRETFNEEMKVSGRMNFRIESRIN